MADRSDDIVAAYQDVEAWLLREVARAVARGADGTAEHYQARLGEIQLLLTNTDRRLELVEKDALEWVAETIASGFDEGGQQALSTIPDGVPPAVPASAVAGLAAETSAALASQRPAILRSVQDAYRQITQQVTTRAVVSGASINTIMQDALDHFANQGITSFTDKAGRKFGIDTYTRMALRTARNNALNQGRVDSFRTNGVDLILVSWHRACSPMCLPVQGRVLSLDGVAGPRTVQDRVTGKEITVDVVATREDAIRDGFRHPNCAHTETAYVPGMKVPEVPDVPEEEHEIAQRQRAIERAIRGWKRREAVAVTPQARAKAKAKVRAWQGEAKRHVDQNWFLRRNYSRERLFQGNGQNAS